MYKHKGQAVGVWRGHGRAVRWGVHALLLWVMIACSGAPAPVTPSPAESFVEVRITDVLLASGSPNFVTLDPAARQLIQDGDRVRTSDAGQGILDLADCMRVLVFGGSNLRLERISLGNVSVDGAQLFSTTCPNVTVNTDADPPVAVIQTSGTVFLAAYRPRLRTMLLWTQRGEATLYNWVDGHPSSSTTVPAGAWSVVRRGQAPTPARPISEIGPVFTEMELWDVYNQVVQIVETEGFGPGAPEPFDVGEVEATPSISTLVLRGGGGPMDIAAIEEAILRALPWQALLEEAFPGQDIPVIVEWPRWKGDARQVEYDLEYARRLMAEPGYASGFELLLLYPAGDEGMLPLVEGVAAHIGNLDIQVVTQAVTEAEAAALVKRKIAADEPVVWLGRQ